MRVDDRSKDQHKTHTVLITATDRMLSGWGLAKGGLSKCAWACRPEHAQNVFEWVKKRKDMKFVRKHYRPWYTAAAHVHIYVVDYNHPALNK